MSTIAVSTNNLYRAGGAAAIVGILLMFGAYALPILVGVSLLVMAVFYFTLYRLLGAESPILSLAAVVLAAGGAILLFFIGTEPGLLSGTALLASFFLPALLAGIAANGKANFPRALAIVGIVGGVFGALNFVVVAIGGGDYTNPNNPALTPFIWATYILGSLATLVWLVWGGITLFRKA
jgi:hypothetical protein